MDNLNADIDFLAAHLSKPQSTSSHYHQAPRTQLRKPLKEYNTSVPISYIQEKTKMPPTPGERKDAGANQQTQHITSKQAISFKARRQSLALATAVHQTFPRELRDLIWEVYLRENPIDWYRVCYNTYWNSASFREFSYLPHFLLPEYSGIETAREAGQVAYKIGKFDLREFVGALQLQHILEYDHLQLNLVPRDYIRNLIIIVDTTEMHEKTHDLSDHDHKLKLLAVNLHALVGARTKHNMRVQIDFSYRNSALHVAQILYMFLPTWKQLKEQKASVTVQYKRSVKNLKERPLIELSELPLFPEEEWRWRILDKCTALGLLTARERHWTEEEWQKTLG